MRRTATIVIAAALALTACAGGGASSRPDRGPEHPGHEGKPGESKAFAIHSAFAAKTMAHGG